jgi:hypothetical protein
MKNLMRTGAVLVAVLAFGPLAIAQADESSEWYENGGKITSAKADTGEGSFEVEDTNSKIKAWCQTLQKGKVGGLSAGSIESITGRSGEKAIACENRNEAACHGTVTMEAINLPWSTTLSRAGTEVRNKVSSGGAGEPQWVIQCKSETEKFKEQCLAETNATIKNKSNGTVEALLEELIGQPCTTLKMIFRDGVEVIKLSSGAKLRVGPEAPAWMVNGGQLGTYVTVVTKGKLKLSDQGTNESEKTKGPGIECASSGEERVGPGSLGEITHLTLSSCTILANGKKSLECSETAPNGEMTAMNLPWYTVLHTSGEATRQTIYEAGKGTPNFKIKCKLNNGLTFTDECSGSTTTAMKNVTGGVDETFDAKSEKLNCSFGGAGEGLVEGTELLESPSAGTLTF